MCDKVFDRISITLNALQTVNISHGKTDTMNILLKQFYKMVIEEYDMLLLLLQDISNNANFKSTENDEMSKKVFRIRDILMNSILDCKEALMILSKENE